jgi:histidyl-tRNA synthetase
VNPGFRSIRGMHDILPEEMAAWHLLEATAKTVFAAYGFEEIRIPLLERTEVFTGAIGNATDVVEKEMYSFDDRNGDSLSLRPEGTAGIVRAVLQNGLLYGNPLRLWYSGAMFRHERPQKGRTRQFHQIGAEVFGATGPDVDAELILMAEHLWRELGLKGLRLEINSLGNSAERLAYREELVKYLDSVSVQLDEETLARAKKNPLRVLDSKNEDVLALLEHAPVLTDFLGVESSAHFEGFRQLLDQVGVEYTINNRLVRGLDYYSDCVFEWVSDGLGAQGTVCAGGRYDSLVELQGGKPWPGVGFAMGQERLVELLNMQGCINTVAPHIYMVLAGAGAKIAGIELADRLRNQVSGLSVVTNPGNGSFKSQFKRADRSGAALAIVLGEEELESRAVSIKHLRDDNAQEKVQWNDLVGWLNTWLESHK